MNINQIYERERDSLLDVIRQNNSCDSAKKEYNAKIIESGNQVEVQLYELWDTKSRNKGKKIKLSRQQQQDLNFRNSQMRIVRLLNTNFTDYDSWLTLTYSSPVDEETAYKTIRNYIATVKRRFKDKPVKYVYCTETGGKRTHHHIVINIADRDTLEELWCSASERARKRKNPNYKIKKYGRTQARRLQSDDFGLTGMAKYLSKEAKTNKKKFCCSKNLEEPKKTKTKTLKGRKITKKWVKKINEDETFAKIEILKLFPNCQFNDIAAKRTPYTDSAYVYIRLKKID